MTSTWPDVHYKKLTVPAWVEADGWHEGVCNSQGIPWSAIGWGIDEKPVTRSTILYQLYDPCGECGGKGKVPCDCGICRGLFPQISEDIKPEDKWKDCDSCLKDSDGNPTGAAEDTGQGWKIEEDEK